MADQSKSKNIEGHPFEICSQISVGDTATFLGVDDATHIYFGAAYSTLLRLDKAHEIEPRFRTHRVAEEVLTTCVLSFLSLEAAINLLFYETFVSEIRSIRKPVPPQLLQHLRRSWKNNLSVKDKYLLLPPLVSDFEFDAGSDPYQLFDEFVRFRNGLVHSKPKTQKTTVKITHIEDGNPGGELLNNQIEAEEPREKFPRTGFSTTYSGLNRTDAEKAFEITYRMRLALAAGTLCSPPCLWVDVEDGPYLLLDKIASSVEKIFTPHFGDLNKFLQDNTMFPTPESDVR